MLNEIHLRIMKLLPLICVLIAAVAFTGNSAAAGSKKDRVSELIRAIRDGENKKVDKLIRKRKEINTPDAYGWSPLMYAVLGSHVEIIDKLLTEGAEINAADQDGITPLIASITYAPAYYLDQYLSKEDKRAAEIPLLLLTKGADPNRADNDGNTPLVYAVNGSHTSVVDALLKRGADPNHEDKYGRTALFFVNNSGLAREWAPENGAISSRWRMPYEASDESRFSPQYAEKVALARAQANVQLQQIKTRIVELLRGAGAADPDISRIRATSRHRLDARPRRLNPFGPKDPLFEVIREQMKIGNRPSGGGYRLLVCVASDGTVKNALIATGMPKGLSERLQKAAFKVRYQPAMKDGQPVEDWDVIEGFFSSGPGLPKGFQ